MQRKTLATIVGIGFFAGTLDIGENLIFNAFRGITPAIVFQYIASGLIGAAARRGGLASVLLGVILHYLIALIWTTLFYLASRKLALMTRRPVVCGLIYGAIVYLVMNLIVLPISGVPHPPAAMSVASRINGVLALLFCIGLPVSLLVSLTLKPKTL